MVLEIRKRLPRVGCRKLYFLIKPKLKQLRIKLGRDGLIDLLRRHQLLIQPKRNYIKTTHSKHWMRCYPNLYQNMELSRPEQAYVSDITYVESEQQVHYLSLVTDAYSHKVVGHHLSDDMRAESVVKALKQALNERQTRLPLIHHSDRGLQYCSSTYQQVLRQNRITPSMTQGYDCYQNAMAERVNGILKQEFLIHRYKDKETLERVIKESIYQYNHYRPHLSLGYRTPEQVHNEKSQQTEFAGS